MVPTTRNTRARSELLTQPFSVATTRFRNAALAECPSTALDCSQIAKANWPGCRSLAKTNVLKGMARLTSFEVPDKRAGSRALVTAEFTPTFKRIDCNETISDVHECQACVGLR